MGGKTSPGEQQLPQDLVSEMASLSSKAVSEDFLVLTEALKSRFGTSLEAILLYGSCLRAHEIGDGVADFYVVVNSYGEAYPEHYLRYFNACLPPNVFYLEAAKCEKKFRAKYAVVSMADFEQGTQQLVSSLSVGAICPALPIALCAQRSHSGACSSSVGPCSSEVSQIQSPDSWSIHSQCRSDLGQRINADLCGGITA